MRVFLFDLDGTLYPVGSGVLERLDERINDYLRTHLGVPHHEVDVLRERLRDDHGTTMHGLMARREVDPDHYLDVVHDADLSDLIAPDPALRDAIASLPGRAIVLTNAPRVHARQVLGLLALEQAFEDVITLEDLDYEPKPRPAAFARALARVGAEPAECGFVDDTLSNVVAARRLGMHGVWVSAPPHEHPEAHPVVASVHEVVPVWRRRARR